MPKRKASNATSHVEKITEIVDAAIESADADAISDLVECLADAKDKLLSVILVMKIKKRFQATIAKMAKLKDPANVEVLKVLRRCECMNKEFERMDYHVSSNTCWKITLPDGTSTANFNCHYNGDNEGDGSYGWSCRVNEDEDEEFDLDYHDDLKANNENVWKALGLTSQQSATKVFHTLFDNSIS